MMLGGWWYDRSGLMEIIFLALSWAHGVSVGLGKKDTNLDE